MRPPTAVRALVATLIATFAVLVGTASAAKSIEQFHDRFTDRYSTELCGIAVDVVAVVTSNYTLYTDESFKNTFSIRNTITNPATGKSVLTSAAGQSSGPPPIIDETARTITFVSTYKGLPERVQTPHGGVLLREAGIITIASTFDLDPGEFISRTHIVTSGPHPDADSDFTLICDVYRKALT